MIAESNLNLLSPCSRTGSLESAVSESSGGAFSSKGQAPVFQQIMAFMIGSGLEKPFGQKNEILPKMTGDEEAPLEPADTTALLFLAAGKIPANSQGNIASAGGSLPGGIPIEAGTAGIEENPAGNLLFLTDPSDCGSVQSHGKVALPSGRMTSAVYTQTGNRMILHEGGKDAEGGIPVNGQVSGKIAVNNYTFEDTAVSNRDSETGLAMSRSVSENGRIMGESAPKHNLIGSGINSGDSRIISGDILKNSLFTGENAFESSLAMYRSIPESNLNMNRSALESSLNTGGNIPEKNLIPGGSIQAGSSAISEKTQESSRTVGESSSESNAGKAEEWTGDMSLGQDARSIEQTDLIEKPEPCSQIKKEILEKLEQKGPSEFKLRLEPEELGEIDIKLKFSEGKLIIHIASANSKTQALLASQVDKLILSMGLPNARVEILQGTFQANSQGQDSLNGQSPAYAAHTGMDFSQRGQREPLPRQWENNHSQVLSAGAQQKNSETAGEGSFIRGQRNYSHKLDYII